MDEIGGDHDHGGAVIFRAYLRHHLHAPQFERGGIAHHELRGVGQFLGGFELGFGFDDACAFLAHGLGLHGHHALHVLGDFYVLHFQQFDVNAPWLGRLSNVLLQESIDLVALFQNFIEIMLADDVTQACQRDLLHRGTETLNGEYGFLRILDPKPEHCVHFHRYAIAGDGFLLLDRIGDDAQIDAGFVFDAVGDQPEQAGSTQADEAAEAEDDATLVLAGDANSRKDRDQKQYAEPE